MQRWQWRLLEKLVDRGGATLVAALVRSTPVTARSASVGQRLYDRYADWECRRFRLPVDPLLERALDEQFPALPVWVIDPREDNGGDSLQEQDRARVAEARPDLLLRFGWRDPRGALLDLATHGVWDLEQGAPSAGRHLPAGFAETRSGAWTTPIALRCWSAVDGACRTLATARTATDAISPGRTRARLCWLAAELVSREFGRIGQPDGSRPTARTPAAPTEPSHATADRPAASTTRALTLAETAGFVVRRMGRFAEEVFRSRRYEEHWQLYLHMGERLSTDLAGFVEVVSPADRYWADPHVLARDGRFYVFVEEFLHARQQAHIAVIPVDADGTVGESTPVLELPWHLSYPFVFEHDGRTFMVPETGSQRRIDLYECTDFPHTWTRVHTLMEDVYAVDTTLHYRDGRWWLFSGICDNEGFNSHDELHLFSAPDLFSDDWQRHPDSAIVLDPSCARPAGDLLEHDGRWLRPAQDCSRGYGYGIRLMEVVQLSARHYEERLHASIGPGWNASVHGVHSLAHVPGITVVDAKGYRKRLTR